jgi:hypothetical protein
VDIANLWRDHHAALPSMTEPTSNELRDYRWRLSVSKADFVTLAARLAEGVTYSNFKSAVHKEPSQQNKSLPYLRVWQLLNDVQRAETGERLDDRGDVPSWIRNAEPAKSDAPKKAAKRKSKKR